MFRICGRLVKNSTQSYLNSAAAMTGSLFEFILFTNFIQVKETLCIGFLVLFSRLLIRYNSHRMDCSKYLEVLLKL